MRGPPEGSLRDKLRRAIAEHTRSQPAAERQVRPSQDAPIEAVLGGRWLETPSGRAFVVDEVYPSSHRQGDVPVASLRHVEAQHLEPFLVAPTAIPTVPVERLGFFDIETTGTSGGTGTYIFLAGLGVLREDGFHLRQYFLPEIGQELPLLELLVEDLSEIDAIVTYNGRSFDVPCLETRITLARLTNPCAGMPHIDLLHAVRRLHRHRMEACRLANAEQTVLGMERDDDVPGWLVPSLYFDYVRAGRIAPLRGVLRHNRDDILSLACLLAQVADLLRRDDLEGEEAAAVGRWWEREEELQRAAGYYRRALPSLEGRDAWAPIARRHAFVCKRSGERDEAVTVWQQLWRSDDRVAGLELAKHLEHREKRFEAAIEITRSLLEQADAGERDLLEHRLRRLERKLERKLERRDARRERPGPATESPPR